MNLSTDNSTSKQATSNLVYNRSQPLFTLFFWERVCTLHFIPKDHLLELNTSQKNGLLKPYYQL
uniref:Uncharacterized protein n=1 Tax=Arundo donax TaxID=35708 RepID=A0A0A9EEH1_ARUDO